MSEAVGLVLQQFINNCMSGLILREYDINRINDILNNRALGYGELGMR